MDKPSYLVAFGLQLVRNVLVLESVLGLVNASMFHFISLWQRRDGRLPSTYGNTDGVALQTLQHSSSYEGRNSSCQPAAIYGRIKHGISKNAKESVGCWATN